MNPRPSPILRRLLAWFLPSGRVRDGLLGDLDELYAERIRSGRIAAELWYARPLLSAAIRYTPQRLTAGFSILDIKLSLRRLVKHWGLTVIGGLAMTVAISIGAVTFGVIDEMAYGTVPLDEGERIVVLRTWDLTTNRRASTSVENLERWKTTLRTVEDIGAFQTTERNLMAGDAPPEPVTIAEMTASGFDLARVPPLLGRPLIEEDEEPGAPPVLVIGYDVWMDRFAADPSVVGRQVSLSGTLHTVVGVMPEGFAFPVNHRFWSPLRTTLGGQVRTTDGEGAVFARLSPGTDRSRAELELRTVGLTDTPGEAERRGRLQLGVVPYTFAFVGDVESWQVRLLSILAGLLLIPPCANLAIVIYARTVARRDELATRHALGASRRRIIWQLFLEVLALAVAAATVALLVLRFVLDELLGVVGQQLRDGLPFWMDVEPSSTTLLFVAALTLFAAAIAGLVPAIQATGRMMRQGLRASGGGSRGGLGNTWTLLVVGQVAFSVAALPTAIELAWGTLRPGTLGPGFPADEFLGARLEVATETGGAVADPAAAEARVRDLRDELLRRIDAEPGVIAATAAANVPGEEPWSFVRIESVAELGSTASEPAFAGSAQIQSASVETGFFDALNVPLLAGRRFESRDLDQGQSAVLVDRTFVREALDGRNPLGFRLRYPATGSRGSDSPVRWYEIVGVVDDLPANRANGKVYHPATRERPAAVTIIARTGTNPADVSGRIREIAGSLDPTARVENFRTLDAVYRSQAVGNNLGASALAFATLSVLLLCGAGIYALMSFTIDQRRREIGIRSALGANPTRLLAGVLRRVLRQLGAGALIGSAVAVLVSRSIPAEALGGWNVPGVLPGTAAVMVVVGLLAVAGPARRGMRIAPSEAMRADL